jgi:hypothetical protein
MKKPGSPLKGLDRVPLVDFLDHSRDVLTPGDIILNMALCCVRLYPEIVFGKTPQKFAFTPRLGYNLFYDNRGARQANLQDVKRANNGPLRRTIPTGRLTNLPLVARMIQGTDYS